MEQTPTIGRIVHYKLSAGDAWQINEFRTAIPGHNGNLAREGDVFPMMITRVWSSTPESAVNGQVFVDGNDALWATSVSAGEGPHSFSWPTTN